MWRDFARIADHINYFIQVILISTRMTDIFISAYIYISIDSFTQWDNKIIIRIETYFYTFSVDPLYVFRILFHSYNVT